jgi:endonuclease/exonuclease/phosphatase family metal-dependent hydrolase
MSAGQRFSILLLAGLLGPAVCAQETLRVATLNLWHSGVDLGKRTETAARLLDQLQPDVVGLQEASGSVWRPNRARRLANELDMHHAYRPSDGVKLVFEEGLAVLSRAPIHRENRRQLAHSRSWPFERRFVQWAEVRLPSGQPFILMNTHLTHHHPEVFQIERLEQALQVIEVAATEALARDIPAVLVGDMNSVPSHLAMQALCGGLLGDEPPFRDAWVQAGRGEGPTSCPRNPYHAGANKPGRIDYVLVLKGTTLEPHPRRAWRFGKDVHTAVSDHYGIAVDLSLEPLREKAASHLHPTRLEPSAREIAERRAAKLLERVAALRNRLSDLRAQIARSRADWSSHRQRMQLVQIVRLNFLDDILEPYGVGNLFRTPAHRGDTTETLAFAWGPDASQF